MADRVSKETRSKIMSRIRHRDTKAELALKPALEALGFEYHPKDIPGKPDFAHIGGKVAVFVDGCFWHGCPIHFRMPETNREFWQDKMDRNTLRDTLVNAMMAGAGWTVIRVWEHDLKSLVKAK